MVKDRMPHKYINIFQGYGEGQTNVRIYGGAPKDFPITTSLNQGSILRLVQLDYI